ncbi:transporter substrate-binding domain-containing protein [Shewanella sp. 1CM18E]|uniref:transporter substrate-binding domain-containing protein n=1 Tax=Shewanella sp. 1CM18E TaxID=2929169 RepID=UPI0020BFB8EE|nr:transporter substrate-binding domain-containing protein [Shewanella sp. 1CM18E]MCK8043602.1 transporter substrate-binding domain-containing protein [Shewanella sp. 1CM18E]
MIKTRFFIVLMLFPVLISSHAVGAKTVNTTIPDSWQLQLMNAALNRVDSEYQVTEITTEMNQKRKVEESLAGNIDVFWSMTSLPLEEQLLPIRIPIFKGLLGNRLLIIRKESQQQFNAIANRQDFAEFTAGQNHYWPDADIIKSANLPIVTSYKYKNLYPMLEGGRFDYLALGAQEIWQELNKHPDPALKVDERVLLQYRSPAYFFVSPSQPQLAKDLLQGLEAMVTDGSFDEQYNQYFKIEELYAKANFNQRAIIRIDTPGLHKLTPVNRPELWLDLFDIEGVN